MKDLNFEVITRTIEPKSRKMKPGWMWYEGGVKHFYNEDGDWCGCTQDCGLYYEPAVEESMDHWFLITEGDDYESV